MAIAIEETWSSRRRTKALGGSSIERDYLISGTDDDSAAALALELHVPALLDLIPVQATEISERLTEDMWKGRVIWSLPASGGSGQQQPGDEQLSFDTTGATAHLDRSLGTRRYGMAPPNFHGLIGVNGDSVEGVDATIPSLRINKTRILSAAQVTTAYVNLLADMTGSVNGDVWFGRQPGEVLFLGASGTQSAPGQNWSVSYFFSISPNANLSIDMRASTFEVSPVAVTKYGWEYIWFRRAKYLDADTKRTIEVIDSAHVEQIYPYGSFSTLGIGS